MRISSENQEFLNTFLAVDSKMNSIFVKRLIVYILYLVEKMVVVLLTVVGRYMRRVEENHGLLYTYSTIKIFIAFQ